MAGKIRSCCFTLNNPNCEKQEILNLLIAAGAKKVVIGSETGENGTAHFQGYVMFKNPRNFQAVKRLLPRAHIEKANGTEAQNYEYCTKEGDFLAHGEFKLPGFRGSKRRDILRAVVAHRVSVYISDPEYINRPRVYQDLSDRINDIRYGIRIYGQLRDAVLRVFQLRLLRALWAQRPRAVLWVVDRTGGKGKSYLARYLHFVYGFELFDGVTSAKDIAPMLNVSRLLGVIFDVTRTDASHFSYTTLEQVKNGYVCSGKYQGYIKRFDPPKVIVLANFEPERHQLTEDRWDIHIIDDADVQEAPEDTLLFTQENPPPPCPEDPFPEEENPRPPPNPQVQV